MISLAFAPDGRSLASGAMSDGAIVLWDLATGRPRRRLGVPPGPVICLAYSPDGRWLASTGDRGRPVRLWDLEGRRGDRLIGSHSHARDPVAFSPDGRLLATAGDDGVVRLWDLATGAELRRVGDPGDRLTGVAFSPDGRMLAATGTDADIRLWDLAEILKSGPSRDRAEPGDGKRARCFSFAARSTTLAALAAGRDPTASHGRPPEVSRANRAEAGASRMGSPGDPARRTPRLARTGR